MKLSYQNASKALPDLCGLVMRHGELVPSRNGDTRELTMLQIELTKPWPLEITALERKVSLPAQIAETMWILAGRNDVGWLSHYLPQAPKFSDDGVTWRGGYGPRLRKWYVGEVPQQSDAYEIDQLQHVIDLLKEDPTTRRAVMSIYDPVADTEPGKDIPCNNWLHFLGRDGKLNLHVAIRSNDLMWGWSGINSFEWAALLTIVAGLTGFERGSLTFSISSLHLYEQHFVKADRIAKHRTAAPVFNQDNPDFVMPEGWALDELIGVWFSLESNIRNYQVDYDTITRQISYFPEPMLQSWLYVLLAWWRRGKADVSLNGTSLLYALLQSPAPKNPLWVPAEPVPGVPEVPAELADFIGEADALHRGKDKAYGPSWCKRGEQMSIMANIARKVDRLGVDGGGDTSLDTAQDLMIYLAKYSCYRYDMRPASGGIDLDSQHGQTHCGRVEGVLKELVAHPHFTASAAQDKESLEQNIKHHFSMLEILVTENKTRGADIRLLLTKAAALAYKLWLDANAQPAAPVPAAGTEREFLGNVGEKAQWRAENQSRFFNGYSDTEGA